jgi:glycosyltransferase involved in cell wall biosynthesis
MVSTHLPPHIGGVERFADGLANALERRGYVVDVVTTTRNAARTAFVVPAISLLEGRIPLPISPRAIARIVRKLYDRRDPPVTVLQTRYYPLCWLFAVVASAYRSQVIVIDHSTGHIAVKTGVKQRLVDAIEHAATRLLERASATFFAVSLASAKWLDDHFGIVAAGVVPNAVNVFEGNSRKRNVSRERSALFAGRLVEGKGIVALLMAFERLAEIGSSWRIDIMGEGDFPPVATPITNVRFHGPMPHDSVMEALESADALVLPSTYPEGLPTIALEAGARGVPVVATARGGLDELLGDGERGLVLNDATPSSIVEALLDLERHPEAGEKRAAALRRYIEEHHSWDVVAPYLERYLDKAR